MASVSLSKKLSNSRYNNWVKASLAVLITKEGIEPFVEDEIEQFQQKCLTDICNNQGLPSGTTCINCCTENVVKCPTKRICNVVNGTCRFHGNSLPAVCQKKICHNFNTEIQKAHRYNGPSYKNTDATQWCSKSWEVAKCFMPPDGYKDVVSASETDFNGVNSVIINCRCFQKKVTDDLSQNGNIFDKGREIGKAVRHAPILEVVDKVLKQYFIDLDNILSDTGHLISDNNAKLARKRLSELQNDTLLIGKDDVRKVLDDVAKVAHDNIKLLSDEFKKEAEKRKLELIETTQKSLETLENKENITLAELDKVLKSALKRINTETDKGVEQMKTETKIGVSLIHEATDEGTCKIRKESEAAKDQVKQAANEATDEGTCKIRKESEAAKDQVKQAANEATDEGTCKIRKEAEAAKDQVKQAANEATDEGTCKIQKESEAAKDQVKQAAIEELQKVSAANKQKEEEEYIAAKKNLQSDVIAFYRETCSTINICPGLDEVDASLKDVYIPPYPLYSKETDTLKKVAKQSTEEKETQEKGNPSYVRNKLTKMFQKQEATPDGKPVNSLQEIFYKQSNECNNIYLTAEPGLGKTSFVKWLSLNWCQARDPVKEDDHYFDQEEVNELKKFDFVFVIFLREINDKNMRVDSMIRNTILPALGRKNSYAISMIERVMCEERCLIVLDGLDEWNVSGIPNRPIRPSCVYITTSRPWKFCSIALNSKQIDLHVCIENVQKFCREKLIFSIMTMFKKRQLLRKDFSDISKACKEFIKVLEDKKVSHFYGTPVILAQLLYLWNMEKSIGNSQFEIYSDMVDALFSRAEDKVDLSKLENTRSSQISYFQDTPCETYYDLMIRLGKLAFNMLFSDNKFSSLVFDEKVTEKYLTDKDNNILACEVVDTCLKTGLLSKQPVYVKSRRKKYTCSFQHKTVQEYFAALYIQEVYDTNLEGKIVKKCNEVETILEMGTVFMFLSGVNPSISDRVFQSLQGAINEFKTIQKYRCRFFWEGFEDLEIKAIQDMKVNCAIEGRNNGNEEFNLHLEDVIIDQSIKDDKYFDALKFLVQQNALNIKSLSLCHKERAKKLLRDFKIQNMSSLCSLNVANFDRWKYSTGIFSSDIVRHISELNTERLQYLYVSCYLPETDDFEKFLLFVQKQTSLSQMFLKFSTNENIPMLPFCGMNMNKYFSTKNVPLLLLQLNEHLQNLTLENVPLSQLHLNEHLQKLTLENVPLSLLQLNEHLQELTLINVPALSQLQLNEHLQELTLKNVPTLSQLQLNEHLQEATLTNLPALTLLQLNEHLLQLTLESVPLTQLQLNEPLQQLSLKNVHLSQLQLNEHLLLLTLNNVPTLSQIQLNEHLQEANLVHVRALSQLQLNEHLLQLSLKNVPTLSQLQLNEHLQELSLKNVPTLSQLQLNEHLQEATLVHVRALSQLQLNEHLLQLSLKNVPTLSQLQLNEHLQEATLVHVRALSRLQLNEHLHQLTLKNVPALSLLQLNEHLRQLTLENVPLPQLQLNEHLLQLTLENVPLTQLQLNEHLQQLTLENVPTLSLLQLNKHLHQLTLNNVPALSLLQLNEHLQKLILENVPLTQLQLNEHLLQLTLKNVPTLSQLHLNEHLQEATLVHVRALSQLQLNEHLQQLSLENVPLTQLQLNEHLQQLRVNNIPTLSRLQLNKHLQMARLVHVPALSRLQLNEHLYQLTLESVHLSQLQLNEHLQKLTLKNIPLSHLHLNEYLQHLTLKNVPLSQLQLMEHSEKLTQQNLPSSQQQMNEIVKKKNVFIPASQGNAESINITGSLNSLYACLPGNTVTAVLNCLSVKSKLKELLCENLDSAACIVLCYTLPKFCHLQKIKLASMDLCENFLELPCTDGLQLDLHEVTLTNKSLYKLLSTKHTHNVKVELHHVYVEDDTVESELQTSEQDGSITAEYCSASGNRIDFYFVNVKISSNTFLQFIKLVEKCNSKVVLKVTPFEDLLMNYREGIDYAKYLPSFIVTDLDSIFGLKSVEMIKNVKHAKI